MCPQRCHIFISKNCGAGSYLPQPSYKIVSTVVQGIGKSGRFLSRRRHGCAGTYVSSRLKRSRSDAPYPSDWASSSHTLATSISDDAVQPSPLVANGRRHDDIVSLFPARRPAGAGCMPRPTHPCTRSTCMHACRSASEIGESNFSLLSTK